MTAKENEENLVRVGITHGDINGIGYEVIIKGLNDKRIPELFTPVVFGISKAASYHRKTVDISDFNFNLINDLKQISTGQLNLYNIHNQEVKIELGNSTQIAGEMALLSLEIATKALSDKQIDVLVTAPINKHNIQSGEFSFPGHTEYLASKFNAEDYLMLMVSDEIRIGAITGHIALNEVSASISTELIYRKIKILHESLKMDFAVNKPKIALLGLNPHAGDKGLIGNEEKELIEPAVNKAFEEGMLVYGPYAADGFFGSKAYRNFDGVLAMYHDQTMLPFKLLAFDEGVNYTAGLPIVRTSPAHGTAYDLAGKDKASELSFRRAMYLATEIYKNRLMYREINKDPLQAQQNDINSGRNQGHK